MYILPRGGNALWYWDCNSIRAFFTVSKQYFWGKAFKYNDIKPVYTIVIYEKSLPVFHEVPRAYIHKGKTVFDTGLKVELLQKYWLAALDVFREIAYLKKSLRESNTVV